MVLWQTTQDLSKNETNKKQIMDFAITNVPFWVSALFILFFISPVYLIAKVAKEGYLKAGKSEQESKQISNRIYLFFGVYLLMIGGLSLAGVFTVNTLPPRILICSTIPLFLFYLLYVRRSDWFKTIMHHAPLSSIVLIHVFRFVGVFFFINYAYGSLPKTFAFVGGAGDIIAAGLAILVAFALRNRKNYAIPLTWFWNCIGLLDIISVLFTAVATTRLAMATGAEGVAQFGSFPFSWIPAFAPATIIFLHLIVFERLIAIAKAKSRSVDYAVNGG